MITRTLSMEEAFRNLLAIKMQFACRAPSTAQWGMTSGRGICSSGSSMAGMLLPSNSGTLNNTSSVTPQSGNCSGNAILIHESPPENAPTSAVNWSNDEVHVLRRGLEEYPDKPSLSKYISTAGMLPDKTARDIALRCHWMMPVSSHSLPVYVKDPV
ncbi:hypothetical protein B296_00044019 [Ensete ventricosum]|uniref:Myb-like domain-containing protein n=1 Tax=Ensete ventricosum TaxID=4639 RepID=A0A426ZCK2_ENSVE|nr:hypothetical protein B296_00044019 [Ensete ventricosum]